MRDEADRILDAALSSYSNQDPPWGLEQQVLSRLTGERRRKRAWWWASAVTAVAAAACCLPFLIVTPTQQRTPAPATPSLPRPALTDLQLPRPANGTRPKPRKPAVDRDRQALLLLAKLPPEDLIRLTFQNSGEDGHDVTIEPLQLSPLNIEPLQEK